MDDTIQKGYQLALVSLVCPQWRRLMLADWLAQTDNDTNPNPVAIILHIDAGFNTGPNLTWLIEMSYIVLTKAYSGNTATALRRQLPSLPDWTRVGSNAWAVDMGGYYQNDCPYPLQAMLVQYRLPDKKLYTTLFYYGQSRPTTLKAWFSSYNGRQTLTQVKTLVHIIAAANRLSAPRPRL